MAASSPAAPAPGWCPVKERSGGERAGRCCGRLREGEEGSGVSQPCSQPPRKSGAGVTVRDGKANPWQRAGSQCKPGVKP